MNEEKKFPKKGIVWNPSNTSTIEGFLENVQKRAKVRTANLEDFRVLLRKIDFSDAFRGMNKKMRRGTQFILDPNAWVFPKAYWRKGAPTSTQMFVRYNGKGWTITSIMRRTCEEKGVRMISDLTPEQKDHIVWTCLDNI